MKWKDKTHELDQAAERLLEQRERFKHIYIFGAGVIGAERMLTMCQYGILEGFIDNDIRKQQQLFMGYKVYSLEEYLKIQNGMIVVAVSEKYMRDIVWQLKSFQLSEGKDFVSYSRFCNTIFPIVSVYMYHKQYVNLTQISLTERCSLKCKKCAHGCFAVDNRTAKDLTLKQVCRSADAFFSKVDFVQEFVLIGGEPLLYGQLSEAIQYIGDNYRQKIGIFSITTNGTIIPNASVLQLCREYRVLFRISNYREAIPELENMHKKLTGVLEHSEVKYYLSKQETEWMDYGFDYVDHKADGEKLAELFDACKTPCREVRENRFYFCVMARSVSENMGFYVGEDDYLDLDALQGEKGRKEFLEYNLGFSEKGYLDMCNYCHGADSVNYPIPAAEQVNR